eukprot:618568_1
MALFRSTYDIKKSIPRYFVLAIEGYVRLIQGAIITPQQIIDLVLFMYAKPTIVHLKCMDQDDVKYISFCPILDIISWDSFQMKTKVVFGISSPRGYINSFKCGDRTIDISNFMASFLMNESVLFQVIIRKAEDDPQNYLDNVGNVIFNDVADFIETLPPKEKAHLWKHAVKDRHTPAQAPMTKFQVVRLIGYCIFEYFKSFNKSVMMNMSSGMRKMIDDGSLYIYNKYNPLRWVSFENDKYYFSKKLRHYVQHLVKQSQEGTTGSDA